jgi:uncharacterized protein YdaU (DUF1376 family)
MNYYYHHIGDFKKDTNFLTHEQRSIYLEMLWLYYDQERGLERNTKMLAIKVQATIEQVEFLLSVYFDEEEDCYTHKRIEEELQKTYEKSEKARLSAQARWDKQSMQTHSKRNANGILPNTQDPIPKTQVYSEAFKKFWDSYPNKVKKDYSYSIWKKHKLDGDLDKIIKHLESIKQSKQWKEGFVQHPSTYLNQKMYLDDVVTVPQIRGRVL